ncbi:MAG: SCP2 sterol-binding domain-containing protein [Gammaproteobacteria bacterium]|nr:SCP2 sterol-binding domain-containing protein [Gammaproteobacteria bacterium]
MSSLLKPIEFALNATLAVDPESQHKLERYDHRLIVIDITDLANKICVGIDKQYIRLSANSKHDPDLTISAKALTLLKLSRDPDSLFSSEITIHGDVQFAKQLQDFLQGFDFDWEAQLARVTGDTLSYPIAHGIRTLTGWLSDTHQSLQLSLAEYLREESRLLPDKSEINDYLSDIDKLRADSDRIEARIQRLRDQRS